MPHLNCFRFLVGSRVVIFLLVIQTLFSISPSEAATAKPAMVATGGSFTCVLLTDQTVECWGSNAYGQLGNGTLLDSLNPVKVSELSNVVSIAAGGNHACAILSNESLKCWGSNEYGQLGDGTGINQPVPVLVTNSSGTPFTSISLSEYHTCAVDSDSQVWCWGDNRYGQLGVRLYQFESKTLSPLYVLGNVQEVNSRLVYTCALLKDSSVSCWGYRYSQYFFNSISNCYNGPNYCTSLPTPVSMPASVEALGAGSTSNGICALFFDATVSCWVIARTSPQKVLGLSDVVELSKGYSDHVCAMQVDQFISCWGRNWVGQVGDGSYTDRLSPFRQNSLGPVLGFSSGGLKTCSISMSLSLRCWGQNSFSELGYTSALADSPNPVVFPAYAAPGDTVLQTLLPEGLPRITGSRAFGSTVKAEPGDWGTGVEFTYQWMKSFSPIEGETNSTYVLKESDSSGQISVRITAFKSGFIPSSLESESIRAGQIEVEGDYPKMSGELLVGSELTVTSPQWAESGVGSSYQWYRNGISIFGAVQTKYTLTTLDVDSFITVKIKGNKLGFQDWTGEIDPPSRNLVWGTIGDLKIYGSGKALDTLTVVAKDAFPTTPFAYYQWLRNGVEIVGATTNMYTPLPTDLDSSISVRVTATKSGYSDISQVSPGISITPATLTNTPTPKIESKLLGYKFQVGEILTAKTSGWDIGVSFSYQWYVANSPVAGETSITYSPRIQDLDQQISLEVTGSKYGYKSVTTKVTGLNVGPGENIVPDGVEVQGAFFGGGIWQSPLGTQLKAELPTLESGYDISYQWFRETSFLGGRSLEAISGANSAVFDLGLTWNLSENLVAELTISKFGYYSKKIKSYTIYPRRASLEKFGVPDVSGSPVVGGVLTASAGVWDAGVGFSYQWLRNGQPIAGASGETYVLQGSDLNAAVSVRVTGSKFGYESVSQTSLELSIALGTFTKTGNLSLSGSPIAGGVLTVGTGVWDSGVSFSYEWLRNGQPIPFGTLRFYLIQESDSGTTISAKVTAIKAGYNSQELFTDGLPVLRVLENTGLPGVSGSHVFGDVLNASPGVWDTGVSFSYQWLRNGQPIAGANGATYLLQAADVHSNVCVSVTGSKSGHQPVTVSSSAISIAAGTLTRTGGVSISGLPVVGAVLRANTGVWDAGVGFSYQWLRNGQPILGATFNRLKITPLDWGGTITVQALALKPGFSEKLVTSNSVIVGNLEWKASFTGSFQVGERIWSSVSQRSNIYSHTYQWFAGGSEVVGANSKSYLLRPEDVGSIISTKICIIYSGVQIQCKLAQSGIVIPKITFKRSDVAISGIPRIGKTLEAQLISVPSGTSATYQWVRDGVAISGAVSKIYPIYHSDKNAKIGVQVTISKPGYESKKMQSKLKVIG